MKTKHRSYLQENQPNNSTSKADPLDGSPPEPSDLLALQRVLQEHGLSAGEAGDMLRRLAGRTRQAEQQLKILRIENECLINVIEHNEVNLPSRKESLLQ
jgi:hypothetical protein